jgi:hypothetical protein
MSRVGYHFSGATKGYHISLDGKEVHFTQEVYQRDMFMAELNAKLNTMSFNSRLIEQNQRLVEALEKIKKYNSTNFDKQSIPIDNIVDESLQANKLLNDL